MFIDCNIIKKNLLTIHHHEDLKHHYNPSLPSCVVHLSAIAGQVSNAISHQDDERSFRP